MSILKSSLSRIAVAAAVGLGMLGLSGAQAAAVPTTLLAPAATQCGTPVGTPGYIQALSFHKRSWPLTGGLHMDSAGTFDRNTGTVSAVVHLYNSYLATGYTGTTTILMRDKCGGLVGVTKPGKWGVEAKAWFWNANERRVVWTASIDPRLANRVASVEVVHDRFTTGENMKVAYNITREAACLYIRTQIPILPGCPIPTLS